MSKTITGTFQYPDGSAVANGVLKLQLSQDATVSGTAQVAPKELSITLDATGAIPSNTTLLANDELTPSGTVYQATVYTAAGGGRVYGPESWSITGSSPINLNNLTPTSQNVSFVSPLTSVGLVMPGEFSVSGSPLTANGNLTVTKVNQNANVVYSGPSTGGSAAPTFRALVDADIPTTLANHTLTSPAISNPTTTGTDSGTQTLKNKTLNGASSGNAVTLLNAQGQAANVTGNSTDQLFFSYTLPANVLQSGKAIRLVAYLFHITGSAAVTYKVSFGGTVVALSAQNAANGQLIRLEATIIATGPSAENIAVGINSSGTPAWSYAWGTAAVSLAANQTVGFTFNVANTDAVRPDSFTVELLQ